MKWQGSQFAQQIEPPTVKAEQWKQCLCREFVVMLQFRADRKFNARIVFVLVVVSFCNKKQLLFLVHVRKVGQGRKATTKRLMSSTSVSV